MTTIEPPSNGHYAHLPAEQRAEVMIRMRAEGCSLQAIADAFGLTRERVRQIIRAAGGPSREEAAAARSARLAQERQELRERALLMCRENPGISAEEIGRELGVSAANVRRALGRDARRFLVTTHQSQSVFTDEEVLDHVRQAAAIAGGRLTVRRYEQLREQFGGASAPLVLQRFGTWRTACSLAGVEHGRPVRSNYARRWTQAELVDWVARYLSADGSRGSFSHYEAWARKTPGAPSGQTIRTQLGRWSISKSQAIAALLARGGGAFGGPDGEQSGAVGLPGHPDGEHAGAVGLSGGPDGEQAGVRESDAGDPQLP